jgi:hypothetical protein
MRRTLQNVSRLLLFAALYLLPFFASGQAVFSNEITNTLPSDYNPFTLGQVVDSNITASGIGRGSGITASSGSNRYAATGWTTSATGITTGEYFEFTLTPNSGYKINFVSLTLSSQKSSSGPATASLRSSKDNYAASIHTFTLATTAASQTLSLSAVAYQNITSPITFRVYLYDTPSNGASGTASINDFAFNGTVVQNSPTAPTAPVATAATNNTTGTGFTANWNAVAGATGYRLDVASDPAFTAILEDYDNIAVAGLSKAVTSGVLPGTTYYYRVRAENGATVSVNSNTVTVAVPQLPFAEPVATMATGILDNGFTANWDAVAGATGYYLDVSTLPDFGTTIPGVMITETFETMPAPSQTPSTHTWTGIEGITWTATLLRTDRVIGTTTDRVLCLFEETPSNNAYLESGVITGGLTNITFDAWKVLNNGLYSTLTVFVLTGDTFENKITIGSIDTPSTIAKNVFNSGPIAGVTGNYKIRIEVTANYQSTPGNMARSGINNLKFGADEIVTPSFVTGYNNLNVGNATSYQVTGLIPNTTYYYRVRAYNATATSGNSNVISVQTVCPDIAAPTGQGMQEYTAGETIANLDVTGTGVVWYADEALTQILPDTTPLTDGATYYAVSVTGACTSDTLAVTVDEVLSNAGFDIKALQYYPNPVEEIFTIKYKETISSVEVYNLLGQAVIAKTPGADSFQLDMSILTAGTYMVRITAGNNMQNIKIIKK